MNAAGTIVENGWGEASNIQPVFLARGGVVARIGPHRLPAAPKEAEPVPGRLIEFGGSGTHLHLHLPESGGNEALLLAITRFMGQGGKVDGSVRAAPFMDEREEATGPAIAGAVVHPAGTLIERYAIEHRAHMTEQHIREKVSLAADLCAFAGRGLESIGRDDVARFLDHCATHGRPHRLADGSTTKRKTKAGAKTRQNYLFGLRSFFQWAVEIEAIRANPCEHIRAPKSLRRQQRAFTIPEARAIIAAAGVEESAYLQTLMITGVRANALRMLPTRFFLLTADAPHLYIPPEFSKKRREYWSALDEGTAARLRDLLATRGPEHRPNDPLFENIPKPAHMVKKLRRLCKRAGVALIDGKGRSVGLHCFRRGTITRLLDLGFDAKVAQLQAGHAQVSTTLGIYSDRDLSDQTRAAEALGAALACISGDTGNGAAGVNLPPRSGKSFHNPQTGLAMGAQKGDSAAASQPMLPVTTLTSPAPDCSVCPADSQSAKADQRRGGDLLTAARTPGKACMSKWAQQGSNLYPSPERDIAPRRAALLNRVLDALINDMRDIPGSVAAEGAAEDDTSDPHRPI